MPNLTAKGRREFIETNITSASYMQNDKELRPIYSLQDLSSKLEVRDFDYAPTNMSTAFSEASDEIGRGILSLYADNGQGENLDLAHRLAIDATIAESLGLDYREVARNHKYYVNLFAGDDVEDRGFGEALAKAWEREGVEQDIAGLQNRFDASRDEKERKRLLREIEDLETKALQLQDYTDRGWLGNSMVNTAPIIRQATRTIMYTAVGAAIGAGLGGMFTGTATAAGSVGNFMKALTLSRSFRVGATAGRVADGVFNTYARERGSFSRQLYGLVDGNENRISDEIRNNASSVYGLLSTMVEYFLPEPGLESIVPNGLSLFMKKSIADAVKNQALRFGARMLLGAAFESTEEFVQSLLSDMTESAAKGISNAYGITSFKGRPISEAIGGYLTNAFEAFSQAFIPSLLAGIPGAAISIGTDALQNYNVAKSSTLRTTTPDQKASADQFQNYDEYAEVVPSDLIRYRNDSPSESFMQSITTAGEEGSEGTVQTNGFPAVQVRKVKGGYFAPVDEYNDNLAKYLYDLGATGMYVRVQSDDTVVAAEDISNAADQHSGFYDAETNAVYVSNQEQADAVKSDLGSAVIRTERIDDMTERVVYRDEEGQEASIDIIADPTLSNVLERSETPENTASSEENMDFATSADNEMDMSAKIDSWMSRPAEWFSGGDFTADMAETIRKNPSQVRSIIKGGLYAYLRKVNPDIDEVQADALADANAVLMIHLANAQGNSVDSFIAGLSGLGVVNDPSVRGRYVENGKGRQILLNPETMSPVTFSHEVGHYFLITLPDGDLKDLIIDTYRKAYEADGNIIGRNMQEAFSNGLAEYEASGRAANPEIRNVFRRLMDAMRAFINRLRGKGLSEDQIALYDLLLSNDSQQAAETAMTETSDGISFDEAVDDLTPEQRALRERIARGRLAQAARRRRFFQNVEAMMDSNLYVETSDLDTFRNSIENEIRARRENGETGLRYQDDPRWVKVKDELAARDRMLMYPKSYADYARDDHSSAEFVQYVREHSGHSETFTDEEVKTAEKFYGYVNTPNPRAQIAAFVEQYSTRDSLMALKTILGPRRVRSRSRSGRTFTRQYIPTSRVWQEIRGLTRASSAADARAIIDSIRSNPEEWYQAYLNALISGARIGRQTAGEAQIDLEAVAMAYYAGKRDSEGTFYERIAGRSSESEKDARKAREAISFSTAEGRRAGRIKRRESLTDTYVERVVPKTLEEVQLEKERARAREAIGRAERAIKRMSNISMNEVDARFVPITQWLYAFMHGGRTGVFSELAGTSSDRYQDILEGRETPSEAKTMYDFYPNMAEDAEGIPEIPLSYSDEYAQLEGFSANLGGFRFDQNEIPKDLADNLSAETIRHIREAESWNDLTAEDIVDIADGFRMAKRWAQDVQVEKRRQRIAGDKNKSMPVAQRLLKENLSFTDVQLLDVGHQGLGLNRAATPEEAMDYYRKNPARLIDSYDDRVYANATDRAIGETQDALRNAYLGFIKIQRFTRALDGEENGPIFNAFYRDVFESYQNMTREILRREENASKALAPIIGDPGNRSLTREQRRAERKKRKEFLRLMAERHKLVASSGFANERNTRELSGYDLQQMYLNSKNKKGFQKLIDPDHGSGLSLEALMDYVPEQVVEFVDLELRLRDLVVAERNRINTDWNRAQLRRMEADESYEPKFRPTNQMWEDLSPDFKGASFIGRSTSDLRRILEEAKGKESILNEGIRKVGDIFLEQLAAERDRLIEADYQQRNELMVIERNYWPLVGKDRGVGQTLNLFGDDASDKATPAVSMLKERDDHAIYDVIGPNPFSIFYSAIAMQERFINMGESLRTIDRMWSKHGGNIGEIIERKYGKKVRTYLYDYLRRMAGKDDFNEFIGLEGMNALLPRLQASYIGLSPLTLIRQYVSLINAASRKEVSHGKMLSTLYRYATDSVFREEVKERVEALAPEIANTDLTQEIGWQRRMEQMQFRSDDAAARARDFFTSWIRFHDKVTKEVTWMAAFETARKRGDTESEAAFKASNLVQETMSVGDPVSRSEIQENRNAIVRYMFMFTTDIFNTWNILFGDVPSDWSEGDKLRAVKRVAGVIGVSAALALIQGGWLPEGDDDDLAGVFDLSAFMSDFTTELLTSVPLVGPFISDAASGYPASVPVLTDSLRNLGRVISKDSSAGKRIDAIIDEAIVAAGTVTGAPVSSARRGINVFYTPEGGFVFNPLAFLNADYGDFGARLFD